MPVTQSYDPVRRRSPETFGLSVAAVTRRIDLCCVLVLLAVSDRGLGPERPAQADLVLCARLVRLLEKADVRLRGCGFRGNFSGLPFHFGYLPRLLTTLEREVDGLGLAERLLEHLRLMVLSTSRSSIAKMHQSLSTYD